MWADTARLVAHFLFFQIDLDSNGRPASHINQLIENTSMV